MYHVPNRPRKNAASSRIQVVAPLLVRTRGRPKLYHVPTSPMSFRIPTAWREEGSRKAKGKVNLTHLFAIHYRIFLDLPLEETLKFIKAWENRYGSIVEEYV